MLDCHLKCHIPVLVLLSGAMMVAACLPDDTRPTPGHAEVTLSSYDDIPQGFSTDDGWRVRYETFLMSFGDVQLDGDDCATYSESDYLRILDLTRSGPQKVNTIYAVGPCDVTFAMHPPSPSVVLGEGVDDQDLARMLSLGSDDYVHDSGVSVYVSGVASTNERRLDFAWTFRSAIEYENCATVQFEGGDTSELSVRVRGKTLFLSDVGGDTEATAFEPYAEADTDADGHVTLSELEAASAIDGFRSLGERLYQGLLPRLPQFEGCELKGRPVEEE